MVASRTTALGLGAGVAAAVLLWKVLRRDAGKEGEDETTPPFEPRPYRPSDRAACAKQITASFADDPFVRTLVPRDSEYEAVMPVTTEGLVWAVDTSFALTDVLCDESGRVVATALWEEAQPTPGAFARMVALLGLMTYHMGLRKMQSYAGAIFAMEGKRHHHAGTALHLQILGTCPSMQNKGLGGKLIEVGIARAEARGVPCYLESSNPKNVPFYKRHGFAVVEEYYHFEGGTDGDGAAVQGKGPLLTLMKREIGGGARP